MSIVSLIVFLVIWILLGIIGWLILKTKITTYLRRIYGRSLTEEILKGELRLYLVPEGFPIYFLGPITLIGSLIFNPYK